MVRWCGMMGVVLVFVLAALPPAAALTIDIEGGGWTGRTAFIVSTDASAFTAEFKVFTAAGTVVDFTPFTPTVLACPQNLQHRCFVVGPRLPSVAQPIECSTTDDPQKCVESGYNYTIRLTAGIQNQTSVEVDTAPPGCAMNALPALSRNPVPLSWSSSDSLSGVKDVTIQKSSDGVNFQTVGVAAGTTMAADLPEGQNYLRCVPRDRAGNVGQPSASATVIVDNTPPASSLNPLPAWISPFSPQFVLPRAINVSWTAAGAACFSLQWSTDNTVFTNVTKSGSFCLPGTSEIVGDEPTEPVLQDGAVYYFRLLAFDAAGNPSALATAATTLDLTPPLLAMEKRIGNEVIAGPVLNSSSTSSVTISLSASDAGSGLQQVRLLSRPVPGIGAFQETACTLPCTTLFTLQPLGINELEVKGRAEDNAGNIKETVSFFVLRHPLIRLPSGLSLIMGQERQLEVSIRNPLPVADKLTVNLCGSVCPFHFTAIAVEPPGGIVYGPGNTSVNITLPPYSARSFPIIVRPSEVYAGGGLPLLAFGHSGSDPYLDDVDRMDVAVDFPPEFPDMSWWSTGLLLLLSGVVFLKTSPEKTQEKRSSGSWI